jgi:hypothetical protein
MKEQPGKRRAIVSVLGSSVLAIMGLAIALALVEMFMRAFPNWVPSEVRVNPPARRVKAFIDETYDVRQSDGDLFYYMRGNIKPLSPNQDQVLAQVHMITDAHGFRNAPPEKATYGMVALGDSFTIGGSAASPWPQKLADDTAMDVLNLGGVAFGPQDELKVLQQYGLQKKPQWVILAYFEGNDLYDAAAYEQANPFILLRFGKYMLNQGMEAWHTRRQAGPGAAAISNYRYPITITINHKDLEMAFFSYYVSWLTANRDAIEPSQDYRLMTETILQMQELSEAAEAHFLLVLVPSKERVYLPYLHDADLLTRVFTGVPTVELDRSGFLQFTDVDATPELAREHMDDQDRLLADFAAGNQMDFLDLTPVFQEEAGTGAELYYPFDTHWNQLGQDLAAGLINKYIGEMLLEPSGETTGH